MSRRPLITGGDPMFEDDPRALHNLNRPEAPVERDVLSGSIHILGVQFGECDTGGGCRALVGRLGDVEILITAYDEAELPTATDWSIGFYDADGHQFRLAAHDGTNVVIPG